MSRPASIIASIVSRVSPFRDRTRNGVYRTRNALTDEQEDEIVDIFKLFDSNIDGLVTKFELKEALWSLGQHLAEEELDSIFREHDTNESQALDCSEFRTLIMNRLSYKNTREEYVEAFRAIDTNKDGSLDIDELQRLMAATGYALSDRELEEIFGALDKDGSGRVDLEEFVDEMMTA